MKPEDPGAGLESVLENLLSSLDLGSRSLREGSVGDDSDPSEASLLHLLERLGEAIEALSKPPPPPVDISLIGDVDRLKGDLLRLTASIEAHLEESREARIRTQSHSNPLPPGSSDRRP
ncbi:MAG TPA: hypothetical protein EYN79_07120 [Planctomycetes bacterium]|nr:hypothetical protein [Planctomycetota bacterium]